MSAARAYRQMLGQSSLSPQLGLNGHGIALPPGPRAVRLSDIETRLAQLEGVAGATAQALRAIHADLARAQEEIARTGGRLDRVDAALARLESLQAGLATPAAVEQATQPVRSDLGLVRNQLGQAIERLDRLPDLRTLSATLLVGAGVLFAVLLALSRL